MNTFSFIHHPLLLLGLVLPAYLHLKVGEAFEGWIDPDTKPTDKKRVSLSDGLEYDLVMSDEFNRAGRTFKDGHDPIWTALDKSDDDQTSSGRKSLQFYNSSTVSTSNEGYLVIETNTEDTKWRGWNPYHKKYETLSRHFKSGMIQSWNKFCYTGGILEIDVQFPGSSDVSGLWPAIWLLGNLGRATYEDSTNKMWPWSYERCDRELQHAQEVSGCDITEHYSMHAGQGRGATEIDLIEVMSGPTTKLPYVKNNVHRPYSSMTLQVAPGIPSSKKRPQSGTIPEWGFKWYSNLSYGDNVSINPFFYGTYLAPTNANEPVKRSKAESYQCDAISSLVTLNSSYWENMHTFRLEWQPGTDGYVRWYVDGKFRFGIDAEGLKEMGSIIPNEPSYVIINTAISTSWGFPNPPWGCTLYDCKDPEGQCGVNPGFCKSLPAYFKVDYVRVYQNKNDPRQTVGCNPPDFPTRKFILGHEYRYKALDVPYSLKPVVAGGGRCEHNSNCGTGTCRFGRCMCNEDWTGPRCLVPDYKNDFPDWEVDEIILSSPRIPFFLAVALTVVFASLSLAAIFVWRKRKALLADEKIPSWL